MTAAAPITMRGWESGAGGREAGWNEKEDGIG